MSLTEKNLDDIETKFSPLSLSENQAKTLIQCVTKASIFVSLCGVEVDFASIELLNDYLSTRKVTNPSGI
jgi:hypothetical protein